MTLDLEARVQAIENAFGIDHRTAAEKDEQAKADAAIDAAQYAESVGIEATPAAKELAEEQGVDLTSVEGSGAGGKITKSDVAAKA